VLEKYSNFIKTDEDTALRGNKYYENHLKALEMQKQEEEEEKAGLKIKIMQQAAMMQYDDDFDEEDNYT